MGHRRSRTEGITDCHVASAVLTGFALAWPAAAGQDLGSPDASAFLTRHHNCRDASFQSAQFTVGNVPRADLEGVEVEYLRDESLVCYDSVHNLSDDASFKSFLAPPRRFTLTFRGRR
jgi:hypothetical protein